MDSTKTATGDDLAPNIRHFMLFIAFAFY